LEALHNERHDLIPVSGLSDNRSAIPRYASS